MKVWGMLANGHLCIHVLPVDEDGKTVHMNGPTFREMMEDHALDWKRRCWPSRAPQIVHLIQDHERCLWQKDSVACLKALKMPPVTMYPVNSPDLNPIEQVWSLIRTYLDEKAPTGLESREAFLCRLHGAVRHFNASKRDVLLKICRDQKKRAQEVLDNDGGRIGR